MISLILLKFLRNNLVLWKSIFKFNQASLWLHTVIWGSLASKFFLLLFAHPTVVALSTLLSLLSLMWSLIFENDTAILLLLMFVVISYFHFIFMFYFIFHFIFILYLTLTVLNRISHFSLLFSKIFVWICWFGHIT